jgi:murein L,D-transpeptidase YafK
MEIDNQIINFYSAKGILPNNLEDLAKGYYDISSILIDRQNEKPYVYEKIGENTYNLCAEFNKVTEEKNMNISYPYGDYITWGHPAGYYCFNKTVNPNLYSKPIPAY